MKLDRLTSQSPRHSQESIEWVRPAPGERIRRIDALEGADGDRQRSLQQEMSEIEAGAIGTFNGGAHVLQDAHDLALQVTALGAAADQLIKPGLLPMAAKGIDDLA
jgi:hypothetical protein